MARPLDLPTRAGRSPLCSSNHGAGRSAGKLAQIENTEVVWRAWAARKGPCRGPLGPLSRPPFRNSKEGIIYDWGDSGSLRDCNPLS